MRIITLLSMIAYTTFLSFYIYSIDEKLKAQEEALRISEFRLGKLSVVVKSME